MRFLLLSSILLYSFLLVQYYQAGPIVQLDDVVHHEKVFYVNDSRCNESNSTNVIYVSVVNDTSKYVQCVEAGVGMVKNCVPGTGFNESQVSCVFMNPSSQSTVHVVTENVTANITEPIVVANVSSEVQKRGISPGQLVGVVCMNGGVIDHHAELGNCVCLQNFTGHICEQVVEKSCDHLQQILNDTFCVERFIEEEFGKMVNESNVTNNIGMHLTNFTVHFTNQSANYEELLVILVDEIWSEISPEHAYLREYDYQRISNCTERGIGSIAQKFKFYVKYVIQNFESNFLMYKNVLDHLYVHLANRSSDVYDHAGHFVEEWNKNWVLAHNESSDLQIGNHQINASEQVVNLSNVIEKMVEQFNETYKVACRLYHCVYNHTHDHGQVVTSESSHDLMQEVGHLFEQIQNETVKDWNMVVDYGFWYLTNKMANHNNDEITKTAMGRKFWKREELSIIWYLKF